MVFKGQCKSLLSFLRATLVFENSIYCSFRRKDKVHRLEIYNKTGKACQCCYLTKINDSADNLQEVRIEIVSAIYSAKGYMCLRVFKETN